MKQIWILEKTDLATLRGGGQIDLNLPGMGSVTIQGEASGRRPASNGHDTGRASGGAPTRELIKQYIDHHGPSRVTVLAKELGKQTSSIASCLTTGKNKFFIKGPNHTWRNK